MRPSRIAARSTVRTLTNRVLIVPGINGSARSGDATLMDFTQASTWVGRIFRISMSLKDAPRTARDIALCVPLVHTCRWDH